MTRYKQTRTSSRGKVDREHAMILEALVVAGYYVIDFSGVGEDIPDLLAVSKAGMPVFLEVKTEGEYPTRGQVRFLINYPGPASLVFDIEQALEVMARYD